MRYHPDKWTGDKATAEARMRLLNEAYEVLSNEHSRKQYDNERRKAEYEDYESEGDTAQDDFQDAEREQRSDWQVALDYYPDLDSICAELRKTSHKLAFAFRTMMLESKRFSEREKIAKQLELTFLQTYFGRNRKIVDFARSLIEGGHKAAARELNRAITVLGDGADEKIVVDRIYAKFFSKQPAPFSRSVREMAETLVRTQYVNDAVALIDKLGGSIAQDEKGTLFVKSYRVVRVLGESRNFSNDYDMTQWVIAIIVPKVLSLHP
jgi:hypothetical protein